MKHKMLFIPSHSWITLRKHRQNNVAGFFFCITTKKCKTLPVSILFCPAYAISFFFFGFFSAQIMKMITFHVFLCPWVSFTSYIFHNMRPNELQRYWTLLVEVVPGASVHVTTVEMQIRDRPKTHLDILLGITLGCHLLCCPTKSLGQRCHREMVRMERD